MAVIALHSRPIDEGTKRHCQFKLSPPPPRCPQNNFNSFQFNIIDAIVKRKTVCT